MKDKMVWVGLAKGSAGAPVKIFRIFKSKSAATASMWSIRRVLYADAVKEIRHQLFIRSAGFCELCGDIVLESNGHMHEKQHRGKGGEISLANSVFICSTCHRAAHKSRNPRFTKKDLTFNPDSGNL